MLDFLTRSHTQPLSLNLVSGFPLLAVHVKHVMCHGRPFSILFCCVSFHGFFGQESYAEPFAFSCLWFSFADILQFRSISSILLSRRHMWLPTLIPIFPSQGFGTHVVSRVDSCSFFSFASSHQSSSFQVEFPHLEDTRRLLQ